jgi:hypothetical protein
VVASDAVAVHLGDTLMSSPSMTQNGSGTALNSQTINAGQNVTFNVDLSAKLEGQIQVGVTFGTVAAISGLQIDVYRRIGSTPVNDTESMTTVVIPSTAATPKTKSIRLDVGRYMIKLSNLDGTNAVTSVSATMDTVDSI